MKKLTLLAAIIFISIVSFKNEEKKFPEMIGELISGKSLSIPKDLKGKFSVISLAYSKKAEEDLVTWHEPLYIKFMMEPEKGGMFTFDTYDVNLIFVPMFTGAKQKVEGAAKKKMKAELDKEYHSHTMVFKGDLNMYKESLGLKDKTKPYLFVLNESGEIVYQTSGAYTEEKMNNIENEVEPAE